MIEFALCFVSFLLGIPLCFRAMASLYAVIDHWYAIRIHYRRVGTGIAVWCLAFVGLGMWLPDPFARAYGTGAACAVAVHILIAAFGLLLPRVSGWQDKFEYRRLLKNEMRQKFDTTTASTRERDKAT